MFCQWEVVQNVELHFVVKLYVAHVKRPKGAEGEEYVLI